MEGEDGEKIGWKFGASAAEWSDTGCERFGDDLDAG
jgi:hypothetical protein